MEAYRLSFSTAYKLADDLAEFINDDGVEIDAAMVDEYHQWIAEHLASPCLILVNKKNDYSYTFDAQQHIGSMLQIRAIAIVIYSRASERITRILTEQPRAHPWTARMFSDRGEALAWLESQRDTPPG